MIEGCASASLWRRSISRASFHEKADRASVHAEDGRLALHEAMQRLQHQSVAAERDHNIGLALVGISVDRGKRIAAGIRLGRSRRQEGDLLVTIGVRRWHWGTLP